MSITITEDADRTIRRPVDFAVRFTTTDTDIANVQVQVLEFTGGTQVVGYKNLKNVSINQGTGFGTLEAPPLGAGIWYKLQARTLNRSNGVISTSAAGSNRLGIGLIGMAIGSSSSSRLFSTGLGEANDLVSRYVDGVWSLYSDGSTAGIGGGALGNDIQVGRGCPVALIDAAQGSTTLADWIATGDVNLANAIADANAVGGIDFVVCAVGINDARKRSITSQFTHQTNWQILIQKLRVGTGIPNLPMFIMGGQRCTNTDEGTLVPAQFNYMKDAEKSLDNPAQNVFWACNRQDMTLIADGLHVNETGDENTGERTALAVLKYLGASTPYRCPAITSMALDGSTQIEAFVTIPSGSSDTTLNPANSATGFQYGDSSSPAVTAVTRGSTPLREAVDFASTVTDPYQMFYGWGNNPTTSGASRARGNNTALPLEYQTGANIALLPDVQSYLGITRVRIMRSFVQSGVTSYYCVGGTVSPGKSKWCQAVSALTAQQQAQSILDAMA